MKALIFDFDGLIVDTEVPIYEAWQETYASYDCKLPLEIYSGCVGSDFGGFDPKTYLESQIDDKIDWEKQDLLRETRALELINQLGPMPGIINLLEEARAMGVACAVASSSSRNWVDTHLNRVELRDYFSLTRCRDDVSAPKPSPELFLAAVEGLGIAPGDGLVLEDSLNGLVAAQSAGIPCLAVPNQITAHLDFSGAVKTISSLEGAEISHLKDWHGKTQ